MKIFYIDIEPPRVGDPTGLIANSSKLKNLLKWCPEKDSLEQIIEDALNWEKVIIKF